MENTSYTDPVTGKFAPGNPGRPPGAKNFTTKVREALEKIAEGRDFTYEELLIKTVLKKAIVDQDPRMIKLMWNYLDGMPVQKIESEGGSTFAQILAFIHQSDGVTRRATATVQDSISGGAGDSLPPERSEVEDVSSLLREIEERAKGPLPA